MRIPRRPDDACRQPVSHLISPVSRVTVARRRCRRRRLYLAGAGAFSLLLVARTIIGGRRLGRRHAIKLVHSGPLLSTATFGAISNSRWRVGVVVGGVFTRPGKQLHARVWRTSDSMAAAAARSLICGPATRALIDSCERILFGASWRVPRLPPKRRKSEWKINRMIDGICPLIVLLWHSAPRARARLEMNISHDSGPRRTGSWWRLRSISLGPARDVVSLSSNFTRLKASYTNQIVFALAGCALQSIHLPSPGPRPTGALITIFAQHCRRRRRAKPKPRHGGPVATGSELAGHSRGAQKAVCLCIDGIQFWPPSFGQFSWREAGFRFVKRTTQLLTRK